MAYYPPTGFHFRVEFGLAGVGPGSLDVDFQEVSGLDQSLDVMSYDEGGENRFSHRLPTRTKYGNLVLKRGMLTSSALIDWFRNGIESLDVQPVDVRVILLSPASQPVAAWSVSKAYPVKWNISGFNAADSSVVTETIELTFQQFTRLAI
jgi:phage tail-like protein